MMKKLDRKCLHLMKIAGALAIYREMGTSVLFCDKERENPPLSPPSLVRVILPSFQFHLFLLSSSSRLGPLTTLSTAPQPPASPKSPTPFIPIITFGASVRFGAAERTVSLLPPSKRSSWTGLPLTMPVRETTPLATRGGAKAIKRAVNLESRPVNDDSNDGDYGHRSEYKACGISSQRGRLRLGGGRYRRKKGFHTSREAVRVYA